MGNGMMCATTPKSMVAQGSANHCKSGAPLPPPPTGAGGGGSAAHLHVHVVAQVAFELVPMPLFLSAGGAEGGGYAFALWVGRYLIRRSQFHEPLPNQIAIDKVTLPPRAACAFRKWFSRQEHFGWLKIRGQIVDLPVYLIFLGQDDIEWEVYSRIHSLFLWSPSCTHNFFWKNLRVFGRCCFNLRQITAKIAYQIGTFKIWWKFFERLEAFARRAPTIFCDKALTPISEVLSGSRHKKSLNLIGHQYWLTRLAGRLA
jgi:hypothetical protein